MNDEPTFASTNGKPKVGRFLFIVSGLVLVTVVLLYGIYLSGSGQPRPDLKSEDLLKSEDTRTQDQKTAEPLLTEPIIQSQKDPENGIQENSQESPPSIDRNPQLPQLDGSDVAVRNLLAGLSSRREYTRWIGFDHLVRKIALVTDNLSTGAIPIRHFRFLRPKKKFLVLERDSGNYLIDPRGYQRYNIYADTLASLDIPAGLQVYRTLKPLLDLAYQELGNSDSDFGQTLLRAIRHLLAAPVLSGEVALVRPSVVYRFADPGLEALSPAQKQFIRMGPRNTRIIQSVLRGFLAGLSAADSQSE